MCESSTSDDMTSFEVVSQMTDSMAEFSLIPEPAPLAEEQPLNGNFDNIQSAFMASSQDLSVQEIQERILELAKDNSAMREALEWNNVLMKEQLSTITAWHNELTTSMSQQQLNLKEASEKVELLEKENSELKEKLKETEKRPKEENLTHDCRSIQTESLTEENDPRIAELNNVIKSQVSKLKTQEHVILEKYAIAALEQAKVDSWQNKCRNLEKVADELILVNEESEKSIQFLKAKISDLETQVSVWKRATEAQKDKCSEVERNFGIMEDENERLTTLLQERQSNVNYEQSEEAKRNMEQIDSLTAQLFYLQEQLAEREDKVTALTSQLKTLNQDYESIPVLKSQVEVYKLDMNRLKQEKEEADAEIRRLNQVVQDLEASFSNASSSSDADGSTRPKSRWNGKMHGNASARQGAKLFVCPLCNFGFSDAQAAQNHANKCLDEAQIR